MLLGSIVNAAAILAGSAVGLFFRWCVRRFSLRRAESGNSLGERLTERSTGSETGCRRS